MTDAIAPSASVVTAYKAYANASAPSQTPTDEGSSDSFGPAVKIDTPPLSAAALSAMDQTAKTTASPTYDSTGNLQKTGS
jgi:hypothetical protein